MLRFLVVRTDGWSYYKVYCVIFYKDQSDFYLNVQSIVFVTPNSFVTFAEENASLMQQQYHIVLSFPIAVQQFHSFLLFCNILQYLQYYV